MQPSEIIEVLNGPICQELLARDVTRLAYVAKDETPRNVPIAVTWKRVAHRHVYVEGADCRFPCLGHVPCSGVADQGVGVRGCLPRAHA
ncbi:hypothetical protein OHA27_36415 [Streptomyces sp. NBC_01619]|uniref:hypothetical protein n=1 Tax=Streptomyces sp. NBC_01619 TaxID=2975901 RepID=UPI00225A926B|nr:hypothetical protein [Streptomyces sp. NBC_01619]MCX4515681.1 hypothetical protein [Streptomyces sp. NBC_01619]